MRQSLREAVVSGTSTSVSSRARSGLPLVLSEATGSVITPIMDRMMAIGVKLVPVGRTPEIKRSMSLKTATVPSVAATIRCPDEVRAAHGLKLRVSMSFSVLDFPSETPERVG